MYGCFSDIHTCMCIYVHIQVCICVSTYYLRNHFSRLSGCIYLVVLALLTTATILALEKEDPSVYDWQQPADICRAICEILVLCYCGITLLREVNDICRYLIVCISMSMAHISVLLTVCISISFLYRRYWRDYMYDHYNFLDLSTVISLLAVVPLRFTQHPAQWAVYSVAYFMASFKIFKHAAIFR